MPMLERVLPDTLVTSSRPVGVTGPTQVGDAAPGFPGLMGFPLSPQWS